MMDIQAALGIHQLRRIEDNLLIRDELWRLYDEKLESVNELLLPQDLPSHEVNQDSRHARHIYAVLLDIEKANLSRWEFTEALRKENIGTGIHFLALHLSSYYKQRFGFRKGDFPNAEYISDRTVSLPLGSGINEGDILDVVKAIKKVLSKQVHSVPRQEPTKAKT